MRPCLVAILVVTLLALTAQRDLIASDTRPDKARGTSAEPQWTDLTNAPKKLVGTWQGTRHITQYRADGSFYMDPHLVPNPPRGEWRVEGDRLVQRYPNLDQTDTWRILSIDAQTLVLQSAKGTTFRLKRVSP